jgi:Sec-independent protein translocase protein TatA
MNKNSYLKLLLVFLLISGSLFACQKPQSSNTDPIPQQEAEKVTNNETAEVIKIETAYNEFKQAKTEFIEQLKAAITDKIIHLSTKSDKVNDNLNNLQTEITTFRQKELVKIEDKNKQYTVEILNKIDEHFKEISDKVIDPLKNGLTKDQVEKVQRSLDFFKRDNVPEQYYGEFGQKTYTEIETFLNNKQTELDKEIKALNTIVNPEGATTETKGNDDKPLATDKTVEELFKEVENIKKDNQRFKLIFIISAVFGVVLIVFAFEKNRRMSQKFGKGLNQENQNALSNISNDFKNNLDDLKKEQNTINKQIEQTIRTTEETLGDRINKIESTISTSRKNQGQGLDNSSYFGVKQQQQPNDSMGGSVTPKSSYSQSQSSNNNTYSHTLSLVISNAIEVSETEQSTSDRRLGKSKIVVLEKKRRGNYLVYKDGDYECLIPSENLRINEYNYKTIEALFECLNYNPNSSNDFQLTKPTVVNTISSGESWQLQQRGVLQF